MSQLTLYLPDALAKAVRARAKSANVSVSAYVAKVLEREVAPTEWPPEFLALPGTVSIVEPEDPPPVEREPLL